MNRARQRFLGFLGPRRLRSDEEYLPLRTVQFLPDVCSGLMLQVGTVGRWQGGALFGELVAGSLTVRQGSPLAPPGWHAPLMPYLPYLLGWSDSVTVNFGDSVDWYGNWLAAPDGRLPDERADLGWLAHGARLGLFDEQHVLVVLGREEGYLQARAYCWDEGHPVDVQCHFRLPDV